MDSAHDKYSIFIINKIPFALTFAECFSVFRGPVSRLYHLLFATARFVFVDTKKASTQMVREHCLKVYTMFLIGCYFSTYPVLLGFLRWGIKTRTSSRKYRTTFLLFLLAWTAYFMPFFSCDGVQRRVYEHFLSLCWNNIIVNINLICISKALLLLTGASGKGIKEKRKFIFQCNTFSWHAST